MTDSLILVAIQLICIIVPFIIIIGIIGNSINIIVLTRSALYNHSCSRYFLALAGNNLFLSSAFLINRLLITGYQLDLTKISLLSCKFIQYVTGVCVVISPYFIVLASIDRYCASSKNIQRRKFSNIRITRWALIFVVILIGLYYINYLVLIDLRKDDSFGCAIRGDTIYKQIYPITQVMVFAIIPPCLMGFFGGMTIYNMKHIRFLPRVAVRYRRTENQLGRMLILQVGTYIVLTLPLSIAYLILVLPNSFKTTTKFQFMYLICQLFFYLSCVTAFILYFFSADIYRHECIRLICRMGQIYRETRLNLSRNPNSILPMNTTSNNTRAAIAVNSKRY
ncbi:unnamed protein product [Rotaria sp. Silwood1]|nr:unnamed protein product [Rotaria sp. Silwood1]CAF1623576.1 unnamed protein product [Rotaria sp. Silwood1]CAF3905094.1 unnamed protein product [Rotaria sp. Silwood1]CAF4794513.1 unnamed protein product [Rotaria sp. Silwood1]